MESVRIEDVYFDQAEVRIAKTITMGNLVHIDFDPDCYSDGQTIMQYSPDAARKLAAVLIMAAEEAELQQ